MLPSTYRRVPTAEGGIASNADGSDSSRNAKVLIRSSLGRIIARLERTRVIFIAIVFFLVFVFGLSIFTEPTDASGTYASRLKPGFLGKGKGKGHSQSPSGGQWNAQRFDANGWVKGSGRENLTYDSPFNRDDYSLTEDECDAFFPGLYKEIDRSVQHYSTVEVFDKEYLDFTCDDGIWSNARVIVYENEVYLKHYRQSDFTRSQSALNLLHLSVTTSREKLPNIEFCINMMDWGSRGKFGLDRGPDQRDVWLMPDYGWFAWPEHVGSYKDYRRRSAKVEKEVGWAGKVPKLFWRGSMRVGTADRESMKQMADGHSWNDVQEVVWGDGATNAVSMEDHCRWKFHGFPEGNTYSGRLRYLQNCRVVIVTHPPRWIQHWTHLYNADWNSPDQNIVYVDPPRPEDPSVPVHGDGGSQFNDNTWAHLPKAMEKLLADDARAKLIADNQWDFFRERYISPASATCYWRKLIKGFASTQRYEVDLSGDETTFETWLLGSHRLKQDSGFH